MQSAEQSGAQKQRPWWQFRPGQSGNPRGRESAEARKQRRDALVASWTAGRDLSPAALMLLCEAADLALVQPRSAAERTRRANAVARILRQTGVVTPQRKRGPAPQAPTPSLAQLLGRT